MVSFYHRDGRPISEQEWEREYGGNFAARVVVRTRLPNARVLLTVWNGCIDSRNNVRLYDSLLVAPYVATVQVGSYDGYLAALEGHRLLAAEHGPMFFCPACWFASAQPEDLRHGWCGRCKEQTGPAYPPRPR